MEAINGQTHFIYNSKQSSDEVTMAEDYLKILTDLDLEAIQSEAEDYASSPANYVVTTYPADFTLEILANKLKTGEIVIPEFQRQFVWNQVQASKLIESFLVGLPVPAIFLYVEYESQKKLLVDGQQRLKSITYFLDGYFGEELGGKRSIFLLKGLNNKSKFFDKTFDDLDESDKTRFRDSVLRAFVIQQLSPKDDTSIYHVFERLNTGGTFLNNQEVRNCVYFGTFNDTVKKELNVLNSWRQIVGKPEPDKRMVDNELILRFLSLSSNFEIYEKPMKDYISTFLKRHREPSDEFLAATKKLFSETCISIIEILGTKPFHVKRGLNAAVLDCVMSAFAKNLITLEKSTKQEKERLKKKYKDLVKKLEKKELIKSATTDVDTINQRFKLADKMLFG